MAHYQHDFEQRLQHYWPIDQWSDLTILLAVSGGADSVALLRCLHSLGSEAADFGLKRIHVAHFNHHWRAESSDEDERFVRALCEQNGLPIHIGHSQNPTTQEAHARNERYAFLQETAKKIGARYLATAHTRNDNIETVVHRILRGTGLRGLQGIHRTRRVDEALTLIRPLLEESRGEVENYLQFLNQPYRSDTTNFDVSFTRNRIRHNLLPNIEDNFNPEFGEAILRLREIASSAQTEIDQLVADVERRVIVSRTPVRLNKAELAEFSDYLIREFFLSLWRENGWPEQPMGHKEWCRLVSFARSTESQLDLPGGIRISNQNQTLQLQQVNSTDKS